MFKNFKNAFKTISCLSLALLTAFFTIFIQPDRAVGATFQTYDFPFKFTFVNHSNTAIDYDFTEATGGDHAEVRGTVEAGQTRVAEFDNEGRTLEQGRVHLIGILGAPSPYFRFWSRNDIDRHQLITLLKGNEYEVKQDDGEISEITGNGFRITVDGGGYDDPRISEIYIQVYNDP